MSTLLSKGYRLPVTGDRGDTFFPDLEYNITRINAHDHDGTDSERIQSYNLTKPTQTLLAASWVAVSGQAGTYRQLVTMPTGVTYDAAIIKFLAGGGADSGHEILLSTEKASATTYYAYINDNSISVNVVYA